MSMNELQKQTNANIQAKANLIWVRTPGQNDTLTVGNPTP